jgi:dolichol-phosphate mannosyltransferase/undecaprenyl-phosphate 4-deoxy-4-formamido-L-arabinose transferase
MVFFPPDSMFVSIVIPVYNSSVLEEIVERIEAAFAGRDEGYEILFVDDFSPDPGVWPALARLAERRPAVAAIQLTRNFGQNAATLCGLRESRGDVVFTMDDDLEHGPEDIPRFLALADHDIVIAQFARTRHSWFRRAASRVKGEFDWLIVGKPRHLQFSSYRMLSRVVVDGILSIKTPHPFIPALMFHVSTDAVGLPVEHQARRRGTSNYTFLKLLRLFSDLLIHNSSIVLRLVGQAGIAIAGVSFAVAAWVIYRKLVYRIALQGWASLFAALLLIGGMLLFGLGVIGEYLIRIIESSEARPSYFVRRRSRNGAAAQGTGADGPVSSQPRIVSSTRS